MKRAAYLIHILLCFIYSARSQEYSYTHYDISDGLAGSVVYCITQDKDGFIWTGTETGVSRFDGTHFKTFTVTDGLPDIEVLNMFSDSKGRVWMAPFRKSVCYYYQGLIHNQDNDSLLRCIDLRGNVENFAEDASGNILIQEKTALHLFGSDGTVRQIDSIGGRPIRQCGAVSRSASGDFLVQEGQEVFALSGKHSTVYCPIQIKHVSSAYIAMNPAGMIWRVDSILSAMHIFATGKTMTFPFDRSRYGHLSFTSLGDSLFFSNSINGTIEFNMQTGATKRFLPGKEVSRTFLDATGSIWFTTMGQGIYRLNSDEFRTIPFREPSTDISSIHAIRRIGDQLLVGDNHGYLFVLSLPDMQVIKRHNLGGPSRNRILFVGQTPDGHLYMASDGWLIEASSTDTPKSSIEVGVKYVYEKNPSELLISTAWGVALVDRSTIQIKDTLWRERSTTLYYKKDTLYIGTLSGLYILGPDRSVIYPGKAIPFLQKRISAIVEANDSIMWIASYDAGIIGLRNGQVVARITHQQGLTSDVCRTLLLNQNVLWVGTDKGLNKVALDSPGYPVIQYTSKDGLGSDMINSIYADGSMIYVGTSAGLSYFDESRVTVSEACHLHLLSVFNTGQDRIKDLAHLRIPYQDKHIRFEFAGISYRSVGSIFYRYRMLGLDTGWQETKESFLEYPTLPSGKYTLQLQAVNKFGTKSALLSVPFVVSTAFWQTPWFYGGLALSFIGLTWLFVSWRIRNVRRREKEREELTQRLAELENTALQAQMNPHFIFNCLNSIQQYIFDLDVLAANRYLTGFARLIRATLNNSSKEFISLSDEIDYLSTYLSLEKGRFKEKMNYTIETDPSVEPEECLIPPMMIQPFAENAMRHGLRHKTGLDGYIHIHIALVGDKLRVVVEDNGIGRRKAAGYKTSEHIEYQSKGMSLTRDRMRMMSVKYHDSIHIDVIDLEDSAGQASGTRVVMFFPLFHTTEKNETL
jgi:ligand-binding sensor domain-containing protein